MLYFNGNVYSTARLYRAVVFVPLRFVDCLVESRRRPRFFLVLCCGDGLCCAC